jgi:hypothetical protein
MKRRDGHRDSWRQHGTTPEACARARALRLISGDLRSSSFNSLKQKRGNTMSNTEILAETEVNKENIAELLKRAFIKASFDKDGDLVGQPDGGPRVLIQVESGAKLLKFTCYFGVKDTFSLAEKHAFVNKINDQIVMVRFSISERRPDALVTEYFLPFEEGVSAYQVVNVLRMFGRIVTTAIRQYDENNMVD